MSARSYHGGVKRSPGKTNITCPPQASDCFITVANSMTNNKRELHSHDLQDVNMQSSDTAWFKRNSEVLNQTNYSSEPQTDSLNSTPSTVMDSRMTCKYSFLLSTDKYLSSLLSEEVVLDSCTRGESRDQLASESLLRYDEAEMEGIMGSSRTNGSNPHTCANRLRGGDGSGITDTDEPNKTESRRIQPMRELILRPFGEGNMRMASNKKPKSASELFDLSPWMICPHRHSQYTSKNQTLSKHDPPLTTKSETEIICSPVIKSMASTQPVIVVPRAASANLMIPKSTLVTDTPKPIRIQRLATKMKPVVMERSRSNTVQETKTRKKKVIKMKDKSKVVINQAQIECMDVRKGACVRSNSIKAYINTLDFKFQIENKFLSQPCSSAMNFQQYIQRQQASKAASQIQTKNLNTVNQKDHFSTKQHPKLTPDVSGCTAKLNHVSDERTDHCQTKNQGSSSKAADIGSSVSGANRQTDKLPRTLRKTTVIRSRPSIPSNCKGIICDTSIETPIYVIPASISQASSREKPVSLAVKSQDISKLNEENDLGSSDDACTDKGEYAASQHHATSAGVRN